MIFKFISRFFQIGVICLIIVGVAYVGACAYVNFIQIQPGEYKLPKVENAQYEILIHNTRNVLYSNNYETVGPEISLQGYWELVDNKYRFNKENIVLNREIFGKITVRKR